MNEAQFELLNEVLHTFHIMMLAEVDSCEVLSVERKEFEAALAIFVASLKQ